MAFAGFRACLIYMCLTLYEFSFILLILRSLRWLYSYCKFQGLFWSIRYKRYLLLIIYCGLFLNFVLFGYLSSWSLVSFAGCKACLIYICLTAYEFSFILFIHHNIHFYFELCTYYNILDIYLLWDMNSVKQVKAQPPFEVRLADWPWTPLGVWANLLRGRCSCRSYNFKV